MVMDRLKIEGGHINLPHLKVVLGNFPSSLGLSILVKLGLLA